MNLFSTTDIHFVRGFRFRSNGDGSICLWATWRFIGVEDVVHTCTRAIKSLGEPASTVVWLACLIRVLCAIVFVMLLFLLGELESAEGFLFLILGLVALILILTIPAINK